MFTKVKLQKHNVFNETNSDAKKRPRRDSNSQSSDPKSDALSIRPQGRGGLKEVLKCQRFEDMSSTSKKMDTSLGTILWEVNSNVVAWYKRQPADIMKTLYTLEFSLK